MWISEERHIKHILSQGRGNLHAHSVFDFKKRLQPTHLLPKAQALQEECHD